MNVETSSCVNALWKRFDCVLMLTWSDWFLEPRSNRYNYATRFALELPVLFVQPDFQGKGLRFEHTEIPAIYVLHVSTEYGPGQSALLFQGLSLAGFKRPIVWIYNCLFRDFIEKCHAFKVYHATEDYFSDCISSDLTSLETVRNELLQILPLTNLVVAVSKGVLENCRRNCSNLSRTLLLENGCDFAFWSKAAEESASTGSHRPVIIYQGGINSRLDFELIDRLTEHLQEYRFIFCGKKGSTPPVWNDICLRPNVEYLGQVEPQMVRDLASSADAGIIPFVFNDLTHTTFPLKAFEYVAAGLPVISTPIPELLQHADVIDFASGPDEFAQLIRKATETRHDQTMINRRLARAQGYDYDLKFRILIDCLGQLNNHPVSGKVKIISDPQATFRGLMKEGDLSFVKQPEPNMRMARLLDMLASRGIQRIAVYGAGSHTALVASALASSSIEIAGLVDDNPTAARGLFSLPVVSPAEFASLGKVDAVVVSSDTCECAMYAKARHWVDKNTTLFRLYTD